MDRVLVVNHRHSQCGVYMFGLEVCRQLASSSRYKFVLAECDSPTEFADSLLQHNPVVVIFNHHPTPMPWGPLAAAVVSEVPTIGIVHDATNAMSDTWQNTYFDLLINPDPDLITTNKKFVSVPRPIPDMPLLERGKRKPGPLRIGSFGFAATDKGFDRLVDLAQESFDECVIRLHIPPGTYADPNGTLAADLVKACRARIKRDSVTLETTHHYMTREELLRFLASNDMNVLLYEPDRGGGGISSAADWALAAGPPMALRRGKMFRNFADAHPSIFVDDLSLAEILANGTRPLEPFRNKWSSRNMVAAYEAAVDQLLRENSQTHAPHKQLLRRASGLEDAREGTDSMEKALREAQSLSHGLFLELQELKYTSSVEADKATKHLNEQKYLSSVEVANLNKALYDTHTVLNTLGAEVDKVRQAAGDAQENSRLLALKVEELQRTSLGSRLLPLKSSLVRAFPILRRVKSMLRSLSAG